MRSPDRMRGAPETAVGPVLALVKGDLVGVIYLVRHGQAAFGTDDYDRLTELGRRQASAVGAALTRRGVEPEYLVSGSLVRQRSTAEQVAAAAGWLTPVHVDSGWNEYDQVALVTASGQTPSPGDSAEFQVALEAGMRAWITAEADTSDIATFGEFADQTQGSLETLVSRLGSGSSAVVSTSAGVISWIATWLLGGDVDQWVLLNRVLTNGGYTTLATGRRGISLVSYNEHGHIDPTRLTYR